MRQWAAGLVLMLACTVAHAAEPLTVYTVNYPLQYFAQRIGGEHARVVFPAPNGVDPAFWRPDRETIRDYQSADLIILNGANYAKWVNKVSLPRLRLVDAGKAFGDDLVSVHDRVTHSHGPAGEHSHAGVAFTTWLDFSQAALQARTIADAFSRKRPEHRGDFERNLARLVEDLETLDVAMRQVAAKLRGKTLLASHPVYQYLARQYALSVRSLVWEPDLAPDEKQWQTLERIQEKTGADVMLWEGTPLQETTNRLRDAGISPIVFDPGARVPPQGDFLSVMRANLANLRQYSEAGADP